MRLLTTRLPYRFDQSYTLYYLTDLHLGARTTDEALLQADIKRIASDDNARWIGGGDYIDAISRKGDKRANEAALAAWLHGIDDVVDAQVDRTLTLLAPIADKCLGLVGGNHESAVASHTGTDPYWQIVKGMGRLAKKEPVDLALGVQGFVRLLFRYETAKSKGMTWTLDAFCHHGAGGGQLPGGHALALERQLGTYDADLVLIGHRHRYVAIDKATVHVTRHNKLSMRQRLGMFVPSYLGSYIIPSKNDRTTDTYAEGKMLPPSSLGTVPIVIYPAVKSFDVVKRTRVGAELVSLVKDGRQDVPASAAAAM